MYWTDLQALLDEVTFPIRVDQFVTEMGHHLIEYSTGTVESVEELCDRIDVSQYVSAEDAGMSLMLAMHGDAVGRRGYSDRDPPIHGVDGYDPVSC